jgi:hypothetical protein
VVAKVDAKGDGREEVGLGVGEKLEEGEAREEEEGGGGLPSSSSSSLLTCCWWWCSSFFLMSVWGTPLTTTARRL